MPIVIEHVGDVTVLLLRGDFPGDHTDQLNQLRHELCNPINSDAKQMLITFGNAGSVSSVAIGILLLACKTAQDKNVVMYWCGMHKRLLHVLTILKYPGPWPKYFDNCKEALKEISNA